MNRKLLYGLALFAACFIVMFTVSAAFAAGEQMKLSPSDCAKCHEKQPQDIESNGSKHKTAINCQNCHAGHRPSSKNNIPVCSQCHQGKPHFQQKISCLSCHTNPHTPLKITFGTPMTEPCLTCHTSQIKQLQENKSKHSSKNCTDCHDVHRKKPECTQCHKPHSADITAADCKKCHKAHMPKVVTYAADTDSKYCAACHKQVATTLAASKFKHAMLNCAYCHQEKHKAIPKCQDCHGAKRPDGIQAKFPQCTMCHKSPHDLNNWTAAPEAAAPAKGKAKKTH